MKTHLAAVLLLAASPAFAAGPSFDCKTAKQPVEKAICADGALAELDQTMAQAYRQAVQRVSADAAALEALKASQRTFVSSRNAAFERPDYQLGAHMTRRIALLTNINIDERKSLLNDWASDDGTISINRAANDRLRVFVSLEEATRGRLFLRGLRQGQGRHADGGREGRQPRLRRLDRDHHPQGPDDHRHRNAADRSRHGRPQPVLRRARLARRRLFRRVRRGPR